MGGVMERLEVLLIGLVLLLAGAVAGVLVFVRPPAAIYLQTVPQPVATRVAVSNPPYPRLEASPVPPPTVDALARPGATPVAPADSSSVFAHIRIPVMQPPVPALWPWALLLASLSGTAIIVLRFRRRRMTYTNQNVGQLLAAADPITRASNLQIMRTLAEQGVLTNELAAAAGIDSRLRRRYLSARLPLTLPRPRLPQIHLPALRMPALRLAQLRLLRHWQRSAPSTNLPSNAAIMPRSAPDKAVDVGKVMADTQPSEPPLAHSASSAIQTDTPVATPDHVVPASAADAWTAEDRVQAAIAAIAEIWSDKHLLSLVTAVDTPSASGSGTVLLTIDLHPSDEGCIGDLPMQLVQRHPTWRAAWRRGLLTVFVHGQGAAAPVGGPLLIPLLAHGRSGKTTRFLPLASCQHLGLYGADALAALHAALGSLLFAQPPTNLALMIIDQNEITPLYRNVAHLLPLPADGDEPLKLLADAIRNYTLADDTRQQMRPLLLVVVEPDDARLHALHTIIARLRAAPNSLVHVVLVQERLRSAGRELYALLPALITSAGQGSADLLPGSGEWPKPGAARLAGRGMRLEGRPLCFDDSAIGAMIVHLRGTRAGLPPCLWSGYAAIERARAGTGPRPVANADWRGETEPPPMQPASGQAVQAEGQNPPGDATQEREAAATLHATLEPSESEAGQSGMRTPSVVEPPGTVMSLPLDAVADGANPAEAHVRCSDDEAAGGSALTAVMNKHTAQCATPEVEPDDTGQPSRRAALLRAASASGRADAPPLMAMVPRRSDPRDREQRTLLDQGSARSPADRTPHAQPITEPDNGFPVGPTPLGRVAMAELMARVASSPTIIAGQANEVGVTKNRLVELLKSAHKSQAKELAETLLAWFDLAGLLAEPTKPGRLRHPRPLTTINLAEIAALLNATACPDTSTVQMLWTRSNEGRE